MFEELRHIGLEIYTEPTENKFTNVPWASPLSDELRMAGRAPFGYVRNDVKIIDAKKYQKYCRKTYGYHEWVTAIKNGQIEYITIENIYRMIETIKKERIGKLERIMK